MYVLTKTPPSNPKVKSITAEQLEAIHTYTNIKLVGINIRLNEVNTAVEMAMEGDPDALNYIINNQHSLGLNDD